MVLRFALGVLIAAKVPEASEIFSVGLAKFLLGRMLPPTCLLTYIRALV